VSSGRAAATLERIWRLARRDPLTFGAGVTLVALVLIGAIGPYLPLGDATAIAAGPRLSAPSPAFIFGTDELGRDFLPRIIVGLQSTFVLSAIAVLITAALDTVLGMAAGYFGGVMDGGIARFADILFAFPAIVLGLLVAAVLGPGSTSAITVISTATLPLFIRVVRAVTLSVAERGFIVAAEVSGSPPWRTMAAHILPNIAGAVIMQLTYALSIGIIIESALSFLGLGVQPPHASLGSLLQQGTVYLTIAPWLVFTSGAVLTATILSINLVGDAIRDAIDPLKGRALT